MSSPHTTCGQVLMLLSNAYDPDPRVRQEALALRRAGYGVQILAWDRDLRSSASESIEGVEVRRVFIPSRHGRGAAQLLFYGLVYLKMFWAGLRTRFDAVHCHDLDTLPLGFLLGRLKGKPVVYDAHESFPDMLSGSVPPVIQRSLTMLENWLIRRVDLLITVGERLRGHFIDRGSGRSIVIGNWKRLEDFTRTEEENQTIRRRLSIPPNALTVVCITQLLHDRKLAELLQAVETCPDVYAIIGGRGVLAEYVSARAAENPRIIYLGFVPPDEIPGYTCAADVVYYGFDPHNPNARFSAPNKLYEALAAGRPLVTGAFGEIGEIVEENRCGIVLHHYGSEYIALALELLRFDNVRERMARAARDLGMSAMNATVAEQILTREYARLLGGAPVEDPQPQAVAHTSGR